MSTPSAEQFLMGGGIKSAKFENVNDQIVGTIHEQPEVRQQTDLDSGKPKYWDDGRPMMQLVVTLQTDLREDAEDDGLRRIYVKGKSLTEGVREAVRKAGAKGLEVGGRLRVVYVADGEVKKRGFNPPKLYLAEYARPAAQEANGFLGLGQGGGQPQPQQSYAEPQQGYQPAASGFGQQPSAQPPF